MYSDIAVLGVLVHRSKVDYYIVSFLLLKMPEIILVHGFLVGGHILYIVY